MEAARLEILQVLKLRWDGAHSNGQPFILRMDELAQHINVPRPQLREYLSAFELDGWVKRVGRSEGDPNPGYYITAIG